MKKMTAFCCFAMFIASFYLFPSHNEAFDLSRFFDFEKDLVLFDDFTGKGIDPEKWSGRSTIKSPPPEPTALRLELLADDSMVEQGREVKWGHLVMFGRSFGNTYNDPLRGPVFKQQLRIRDPPASNVRAIKVSLNVLKASVKACPDNTEVSTVSVRAIGFFFNAGPGNDPGGVDYDGDVFALIAISRRSDSTDPLDVLQVTASAFFTIQTASATSPRIRPTLGTASLGTVKLGERIKIRVQWDPDNDQFVFQRDNDTEVGISYDVPELDPSHLVPAIRSDNKRPVDFFFNTPNCVGEARSESFMKVKVDKVWVNKSALATE